MEGRKRDVEAQKLEQAQATLKRRAYGKASYVAGDDTLILVGGKVTIHGQPRFMPLRVRRQPTRHCKSCGSFRKAGSCAQDPDIFTDAEGDACQGYSNRTYDRQLPPNKFGGL